MRLETAPTGVIVEDRVMPYTLSENNRTNLSYVQTPSISVCLRAYHHRTLEFNQNMCKYEIK